MKHSASDIDGSTRFILAKLIRWEKKQKKKKEAEVPVNPYTANPEWNAFPRQTAEQCAFKDHSNLREHFHTRWHRTVRRARRRRHRTRFSCLISPKCSRSFTLRQQRKWLIQCCRAGRNIWHIKLKQNCWLISDKDCTSQDFPRLCKIYVHQIASW